MSLEMIELYSKASALFGDFKVDADVNINDNAYSNVFLKHDVLYEDLLRELLNNTSDVLVAAIPKSFSDYKAYFNEVKEYEDRHRKNYKDEKRKKYQTRYGMKFTLLLPKSIKLKKDKVSVIKDFIKAINYENVPLKYVAFEEVRGNGTYLCLYISDRAYVDAERVIRYNRDYKSKTGIKKKGSLKRDKEGNVVKERLTFEKFKVSYFKFPEKGFMPYIEKLKSYLIETFKSLLSGLRRNKRKKNFEGKTYLEHQGYLMQKKKIYKRFHHKYKQSLNEINSSKRYVENMINGHIFEISKNLDRTLDGTLLKNESNAISFKKIENLKTLFFKYEARYSKNAFHNENNEEVSLVISQKNGNLPGIKSAIAELMQLFNDELLKVIPDALAFDVKRG